MLKLLIQVPSPFLMGKVGTLPLKREITASSRDKKNTLVFTRKHWSRIARGDRAPTG